jgi:hypothetical protein
MKLKSAKLLPLLLALFLAPLFIAWGTFGHEHINRAAVLALPQPIQSFFYNHIDFITTESTVPDLRKYTLNDKTENPRHYIDLENFGTLEELPKTMEDAKAKYDEKFLQQNGILPWYIADIMTKLTKAFKEKHKSEILFLAADLGHYLGDANMPLHTSANHDGQKTDQKGIHSFWEAQLPELFGNTYNYNVPEAKYIADVQKEILSIIQHSHSLVDTLLLKDKKLSEGLSLDKIYVTDSKGFIIKNKFNQQIHTKEYAKRYHDALNGMVESQMKAAITATTNFWYTAWVNAGKPDLSDLDPSSLTSRNAEQMKAELALFKSGKLFGIESEKEY